MIDKATAKQIAMSYLGQDPPSDGYEFSILDEYTIERPRFYVFFYESSQFLKSGQFEDRLMGNGPILVRKDGGQLLKLGTALHVDVYISNYEASL